VQFERGSAKTSLRLEGKLRVGGNEGAVAAAVAGLGVTLTSLGACQAELDAGLLVRVLADWDLGSVDVHAVFTGGKAAKRSARAFADFISAALLES
jgi:DNA-binding transcriptional LysR family regulator